MMKVYIDGDGLSTFSSMILKYCYLILNNCPFSLDTPLFPDVCYVYNTSFYEVKQAQLISQH